MNEPLHPSNLGEILDRTVQFYRSRFLVFLGISVLPTGVVLVLACGIFFFLAWWGANGAASVPPAVAGVLAVVFFIVLVLAVLPICLAVTALATAAINHAVARAYLGEKTSIRDAYKGVWPRGWRYIGLYLLETLFIWVVPSAVWFGLIFFAAGAAVLARQAGMGDAAAGLLPLVMVLVVAALVGYAIWMLLRLSLAFPACVVEQIGAWAAIKRGSSLSKGTRGRIFLLYLLGTALNWLLTVGVIVPLSIILALLPGASSPQHAQTAAVVMAFTIYGAAFAVQALTKPVYGIALMLFYYDQRIRLEGFDIEWMMLQAGLVAPPAEQAEQPASPEPQINPTTPAGES